jgi:hypothetical protein
MKRWRGPRTFGDQRAVSPLTEATVPNPAIETFETGGKLQGVLTGRLVE